MFRIGLSLYLMLAMLAGPTLCCCMVGHLLANSPRPAEQRPGGCCASHRHQSRDHGQHGASGQRSGEKERPQQSPCPCQKHRSQEVPLVSEDSDLAKELQLRQLSQGPGELRADRSPPHCLSSSDVFQMSPEGAVLPFLTAQEILRCLHILRC